MRARGAWALLLCLSCAPAELLAQTATNSHLSGADLYRSACASCHGPDGKGAPRAAVGFDIPLPDFSDCAFGSPEADADWMAVVHEGGPVRAFNRMMPAFGDALSADDIARVVGHLRSFCSEPGWPRGDLNLPRPLLTEKAFPENEAVWTMTVDRSGGRSVEHELVYEQRVGKRGQYEIALPLESRGREDRGWTHGIGDIAAAYKHVLLESLRRGSILSAGGEIVVPTHATILRSSAQDGTSDEQDRKTVVEPFATFGQILRGGAFLQLHGGLELPIGAQNAPRAAFWRGAVGMTFTERQWYRAWTPMVEVAAARELVRRAPIAWDVVPQLQVSLSTRQHVLLNAGVRVPVTAPAERRPALLIYVLWDWFDGGLLDGW